MFLKFVKKGLWLVIVYSIQREKRVKRKVIVFMHMPISVSPNDVYQDNLILMFSQIRLSIN